MPEFVHLHNHSTFSFFDGAAKIDDLVAKTKAMGMTALALTDHGHVHGLPEFQQEAEAAGVKPILGVEGYLVEDYDAYLAIANKKSGDRTAAEKKQLKTRYHQIVLAKNEVGLDNLHRLVSWAHTEGKQYGRYPLFDFKRLRQYREGLIVTSSCMQGIISQAIIAGDIERAERVTRWFLDTFAGDFYFEVHNHGLDDEAKVRAGIKKLQKTTGAQVICCNDVHYVEPEDYELQKLKVALSTRKNVFEAGDYAHEGVHMKTPAEMADSFHGEVPLMPSKTPSGWPRRSTPGCRWDATSRCPRLTCPAATWRTSTARPSWPTSTVAAGPSCRGATRIRRRGKTPRRGSSASCRPCRPWQWSRTSTSASISWSSPISPTPLATAGSGSARGAARRRKHRGLPLRHHQHRPAALRLAFRALSQPRARDDAGH